MMLHMIMIMMYRSHRQSHHTIITQFIGTHAHKHGTMAYAETMTHTSYMSDTYHTYGRTHVTTRFSRFSGRAISSSRPT